MKVYQKNVTDAEVRAMMTPRIAELMKSVVPRVKTMPETDSQPKSNNPTKDEITAEEKDFLADIFEQPYLSITGRASRLGLSAYKMNALKKSAIGKGLVRQFSVNLGKKYGGKVTLLVLTSRGYREIGKKPVEKPDNISDEHWWWQMAIRDYFNSKGAKAEIEKTRDGKRADVGLTMNGVEQAVEVELSPKTAISNITADLEAGFDKVVCCCKDQSTAREVKRRLKAYVDYETINDRVEIRVLTELKAVKEMFG